jgi:SAM-dependent methyltransferase
MSAQTEFGAEYANLQLARERNPLRRLVKHFYLNNILREVNGPTVDFGCGTGQLLARLPQGSVGIEINPFLVDALKRKGLAVIQYDSETDGFALPGIEAGRFSSLVIAHVLEHFSEADQVLRKLLASCGRLKIDTVVVVVPGARGFQSDDTHKTFVDHQYLRDRRLLECEGYTARRTSYFPINAERVGDYFVFHELKLVYSRND